MARTATVIQTNLPSLEADGVTHARDCECARCDAGFRPSEGQRRDAATRWREHHQRAEAQAALDRMERRQRLKAASLQLTLDELARRTDALLREREVQQARAATDPQMEELLRLRAQGVPIAEALRRADRLPARRARRRSS